MTGQRQKRRWTIGEYVLGAVLLGFVGVRTIAVGNGFWQAIGVLLVGTAAWLAVVAAIAKANKVR